MVQYYWKCSVQLWSLHIAAELERVQRGATRMLARSFHKWRNKWCLHFMTCYCRFFIFSFFSTNLPKRPTPIPPPSILQPPFPNYFLISHFLDGWTLPAVQVPLRFTQKYLQIFVSSKSLSTPLTPLPFPSSSPTAKLLALSFNPVILAHQIVVSPMAGLELHKCSLARLMLSNFG